MGSSIHIRVTDQLAVAQCSSSAAQCLGRSSGSRKCDSSYVPIRLFQFGEFLKFFNEENMINMSEMSSQCAISEICGA